MLKCVQQVCCEYDAGSDLDAWLQSCCAMQHEIRSLGGASGEPPRIARVDEVLDPLDALQSATSLNWLSRIDPEEERHQLMSRCQVLA